MVAAWISQGFEMRGLDTQTGALARPAPGMGAPRPVAVAALAPVSERAGRRDERQALMDDFRRYCRIYYGAAQSEAALAYIMVEGGPECLRMLVRMDDSKLFFLTLHDIVERALDSRTNDNMRGCGTP